MKDLWLQAHTPTTDPSVTVQDDSVGQEIQQNTTSELKKEERESREVGGEEGEREAEGNLAEAEGKGEEGGDVEREGENNEGEKGGEGEREGEEEREEGDNREKEKEGEPEEERVVVGKGGEGAADRVAVNDDTTESLEWGGSAMTGFEEEPFVQAAAQFKHYDLTNILDLLSQAIDRGTIYTCIMFILITSCNNLQIYTYMYIHVHCICMYVCI